MKNWSLLYRNPRVPELSPAYDLVATSVYRDDTEDLGLRFGGSRRFENVTLETFAALQRKLRVPDVSFAAEAERVIQRTLAAWQETQELLADTGLAEKVGTVIEQSAASLLRNT
jgi:serine/threonine-protein kinase HipA